MASPEITGHPSEQKREALLSICQRADLKSKEIEENDSAFPPMLCSVSADIIIKKEKAKSKTMQPLHPNLYYRTAAKCLFV